MTERVYITDVGPRDGLQNQPVILTLDDRRRLIEAICAAGVRRVEVGSFVSPRAVPAMAGTGELLQRLARQESVAFSALIPNMKGYELAREAGIERVALVVYASEGMARENVNMSRAQVDDIAAEILARANSDGMEVIATIAVAFACPFDGPVNPEEVEEITARLLAQGVEELVLADTIGAAAPSQVRSLTAALVAAHGSGRLACHFHDTRGMGLANVYAALESGVRRFDSSVGGLGGCPFAPGASGNVATEDVVMMLQHMGFDTGIDIQGLLQASALAGQITGAIPGGGARQWLLRQYSQ